METRNNKILVPIDFSEHSLMGLEQAYVFAKVSNAEIVLLHVVPDSSPFWGLFTAKEHKDVMQKFKEKLTDFAGIVEKKSGIKVSVIVEKGNLTDKILEVADKIIPEFLVVGTTSSANIMKKIVGSNALRLIQQSKYPVVTVKGKYRAKCKNIILPLDLTQESTQKVTQAIHLAKYFGSKVHIITLIDTNVDNLVGRLNRQLANVEKILKKQNIECESKSIKVTSKKKFTANFLFDYAKKVDGDIILIMTQQENNIVEYFIGSLAKEVIHGSHIPVMSIIPRKLK